MDRDYIRVDFSKLNLSGKIITSNEALKDVIPFRWGNKTLSGKRKVLIQGIEN